MQKTDANPSPQGVQDLPSWRGRLHGAQTKGELAQVVRDFVGSWQPQQLARLPAHAIPGPVHEAEDIPIHAFTLVRQQCSGQWPSNELDRMATFFAEAACRLSQLAADKDTVRLLTRPPNVEFPLGDN